MDTLEIQAEKLTLINWISQLQDVTLIAELRRIQKSVTVEIPQWQQDIVLDRIKNSKPEDYISWEEAEKQV